MDKEQIRKWCALNRASGVGSRTFQQILAAFGSPEAFFDAPLSELRHALGNQKKLSEWHNALDNPELDKDMDWYQPLENRHIITYHNPAYPALLKEISDPPALLFVRGDPRFLSTPQIAVVGSRNVTPMGLENCRFFCQELAKTFTITSGMALGIDGCSHESALSVQGKTIAVVGTGLDIVYPARHHQLAHQIAEYGALVSEFPIGTPSRAMNFPRRNRIICGLSLGTLVIEATLNSGSLITARLAVEQGREVFAIPGSIHHPLSKGCHRLIREGAKLVECAGDVLEELLPMLKHHIALEEQKEKPPKAKVRSPKPATQREHPALKPQTLKQNTEFSTTTIEEDKTCDKVLSAMGFDPCRIDDLVIRTHLTAEKISSTLLLLELDGRVTRLASGEFQRVR